MTISRLFRAIILLITGIPMLQVHGQPANLVLQDTIITTAASFAAINSITAGPNFAVTGTGDATFVTRGLIYFKHGIVIIQGGKLQTISDLTLDVKTLEAPTPVNFSLRQNYPNPFNPSTNIPFAMKEKSHVSIIIRNLLGQSVATLVNEELPAGEYEVTFSPNGIASGVYVCCMTTNGFIQSLRMLLLK
jgi:Secretion system C-terminal sorting domain